jgi:stage II sporulation protein D
VRVNGSTVQMPLEQYVAQALAGECGTFQSEEALKAMAVAARTYAIYYRGRHATEGYDLCATTHCQRLDATAVTARLEAIDEQTAGMLLWFEGKPALACYSRDCGGVSEEGSAVWSGLRAPYLRSHADPYCGRTRWQWIGAPADIAEALRRSGLRTPTALSGIEIAKRTQSGRASVLTLTGGGESVHLAASSFRFAIGRAFGFNTVRSDLWDVSLSGTRWNFSGTGDGHGAGLCQRGAEQMGAQGHTYREILAFYCPGTVLGLTARGLAWQRMSGEAVSLMTTQPDRDRSVLAIAEREVRRIATETGWSAPHGIEIRVYPDVATFRNATGEPGWVAARTAGRRIHMQPAAREAVVRHELLHVFVEAQAKAPLPVWFREGLVEYLDRPVPSSPTAVTDAELRQTEDATHARHAYQAAARKVADLVRRYGTATVLGWLTAGLPREVTNASASAEPTKSK